MFEGESFQYIRDLIRATRDIEEIQLGNSPRAGQMLLRLAKPYAGIAGEGFVTPDHIQELVPLVLPHRWVLKPEAQIQSIPVENILRKLFDTVEIPK